MHRPNDTTDEQAETLAYLEQRLETIDGGLHATRQQFLALSTERHLICRMIAQTRGPRLIDHA